MKKQRLAIFGGAGLLLAFMLATYFYNRHRTYELELMAKNNSAPLVREYSQSLGPTDAKVVLVEFLDPGCETCRDFAPSVKDLLAFHAGKLRLVIRYAPFHQGSDTMVKILEAARQQGNYWEALEVMFETQPHWASHHHPQPDKIWSFLLSAGLNVDRIRIDMNDPRILEMLHQDIADAQILGVHKTPSFFVNGKPLPSFGLSQLKALVNEEVEAAY